MNIGVFLSTFPISMQSIIVATSASGTKRRGRENIVLQNYFYFYENQIVKITKNEPILRVKMDILFL